MIEEKEVFIDHEVRIRMQELCYEQLNRKLNIIMTVCGAIFTFILASISLHAVHLT